MIKKLKMKVLGKKLPKRIKVVIAMNITLSVKMLNTLLLNKARLNSPIASVKQRKERYRLNIEVVKK